MPKTTTKKPYGRQAAGKTIKAVSIDADLAAWIDEQGRGADGASRFVNDLLKRKRAEENKKAAA